MTQPITNTVTLKPCPFCSGKDIRITAHHEPHNSPTGYIYSMCCYQCGATFPNRYMRELLVEAWNHRPTMRELSAADKRSAIKVMEDGFKNGLRSFGLHDAIPSNATVDGYTISAMGLPHMLANCLNALTERFEIRRKSPEEKE